MGHMLTGSIDDKKSLKVTVNQMTTFLMNQSWLDHMSHGSNVMIK